MKADGSRTGHPRERPGQQCDRVYGPYAVEPGSNRSRQVRRLAVAGPNHSGTGCGQARQRGQRHLYIGIGDVAEHAARQDEMGRNGACVRGGGRGVSSDHLDALERHLGGQAPGGLSIVGIEFHQRGRHVGRSGMPGQRAGEVPTLAGAHADDSDGPSRQVVQATTDPRLDDAQAPRQAGGGIVVGEMPANPVAPDRRLLSTLGHRPILPNPVPWPRGITVRLRGAHQ